MLTAKVPFGSIAEGRCLGNFDAAREKVPLLKPNGCWDKVLIRVGRSKCIQLVENRWRTHECTLYIYIYSNWKMSLTGKYEDQILCESSL